MRKVKKTTEKILSETGSFQTGLGLEWVGDPLNDDGNGNPVLCLDNEFEGVGAADIAGQEYIGLTNKDADKGKVIAAAELLGTTPEMIAFIIDNLAGLRNNVTWDLADLFEKIEECEKANTQYRNLLHKQNVTTHSLHSSLREQEKRIAKLEHSQEGSDALLYEMSTRPIWVERDRTKLDAAMGEIAVQTAHIAKLEKDIFQMKKDMNVVLVWIDSL